MKKCLLSLACALIGTLAVNARVVTFTPEGTWTANQEAQTETIDGVTIATTQGVGSAASGNYAAQYRVYKNQTFTVSTDAGNVTKIEIVCTANGTAKYGPGNFTDATSGTYTFEAEGPNGTWEGEAISISMTASTNQVRMTSVVVTVEGTTPNGGETEPSEPYTQNFCTTLEPWTVDNKTLPEGANYIWTSDATYGAKASAYFSGASHASESWLVSPKFAIGTESVMTLNQAANKGAWADECAVLVSENQTDWTVLTGENLPEGNSWTYFESTYSLAAYAGKSVYVALKYTSTDASSCTWEIKTCTITNASTDATVEIKDPSNTAETAYTTAEAIAIIDDGHYDLTKEVYVKGTISEVVSFNETYKSITYWLDNNTFEVYSGKNLGNTDFASVEDIKVGDEVVICGKIKKYNTTYEFDKNNYIVSLNGTTSIDQVAAGKTVEIYNLAGQRVSNMNAKGIYVVGGKKYIVR